MICGSYQGVIQDICAWWGTLFGIANVCETDVVQIMPSGATKIAALRLLADYPTLVFKMTAFNTCKCILEHVSLGL